MNNGWGSVGDTIGVQCSRKFCMKRRLCRIYVRNSITWVNPNPDGAFKPKLQSAFAGDIEEARWLTLGVDCLDYVLDPKAKTKCTSCGHNLSLAFYTQAADGSYGGICDECARSDPKR